MEHNYHEHDMGYKHLFKYKKNFIELLTSFVKKDWTKDIKEEELLNIANLVSSVFLMDQDMDIIALKSRLRALIGILKNTTTEQFEGFKKWLLYIIRSRVPKKDRQEIEKVIHEAQAKEVEHMVYNLERTLDRLKQEGKEEGKQEGLEEGLEKGLEKGIRVGKYTVAKRLLMKGQDIDTVMDVTELSREELEQLMKEI